MTRLPGALTPEDLYNYDKQRGWSFVGPTPEEYLEWDEDLAATVDSLEGEGWVAKHVSERIYIDKVLIFMDLVRQPHERRDSLSKQLLHSMEERGEKPWQLR